MNSESKLSSVGIIGDSPAMHLLARQIETAAGCDLTVPHVVLSSTNGRWPFAAYTEGDSLDDFLDHAMLDLYDMLREKTGSHSETARQLRVNRCSFYQRLDRARRRL